MSSKRLTIGIPFKDRGIELSINLMGLLYQTYQDWDLIIYNDCHGDVMSNKTLNSIFNLIREAGHDLKIIEGERRGPHIGGQRILETATTELILRLDDDVALEPDAVEQMVKIFDDYEKVGAVGPIYIDPCNSVKKQWIPKEITREEIIENCKVKWVGNELFLTGWMQTNQHFDKTPIPSQHLNSGFMYRRQAGIEIGGYDLDLSVAGHREESSFSYRMFKLAGYKLFICPSALAWHFHPQIGGIRETMGNHHNKLNWDHDEKLFLERMEKWLPKEKVVVDSSLISVICLTHGTDHNKLRELLQDIRSYTNHPYELTLVNNDIRDSSKEDFVKLSEEFKDLPMRLIQLPKELAVGEARNVGVKYSNEKINYICFIDDDARILGRYNQSTDWLDYLINRFNEFPDVGAISPIFTWFEELQCHCVSVACMFTSRRVWNIVGGFDPVFGNKEKGTWGYEDTDWSYRCESVGFKLMGVHVTDYPFYHHNTENDHTSGWYTEGIKKAKQILLDKHNVNEINRFCRTVYPFTKRQIETKGPKLNIGCYYMYIDGFINIDINQDVKPDMVCNMLNIKERFVPNSIKVILLSQVLEHVSKSEGMQLLKALYEILEPGGELIVEVPNGSDIDGRKERGEIDNNTYNLLKTGHQEVPYQGHFATYDSLELAQMLVSMGFNATLMPEEMTSDKWESIRIDCVK